MRNLLVDTDIGNDCDDAAAVALACKYAREGKINLLGFTVNTSDEYAADCIDAIAEHYGKSAEIGVYKGDRFPASPNSFCRAVAERFFAVRGRTREEAVAFMRRKLSGCAEKSVRLAFIGQLNNFRALLESGADIYGGAGRELVARKAEEVIVMGGMFGKKSVLFNGKPYTSEFNIATAVFDSREAIRLCPVEMTFSDFLLGADVRTLGRLASGWRTDPVGYAYKLFCGGDRPSWDILTLMYAAEGENGLFVRSAPGAVAVEADGATEFLPAADGKHRYLKAAVGKRALERAVENLFIPDR